MNQTLKDRAWKLVEIIFPVALVWFVVTHWKSFLAWLFNSATILAAAVIPLLLLAFLLFALERNE